MHDMCHIPSPLYVTHVKYYGVGPKPRTMFELDHAQKKKMYQKSPCLYQKKTTLLTSPEWTLTKPICTNKSAFSTNKPSAFPTCATLVDCCVPKSQLGCPLSQKTRMGYLGVSSFPPLSTTFRPTIGSVFFGMKTHHCSRLLPFSCCHLPFRRFPDAHLQPPPPLQCALWFCAKDSFTVCCFFFRGLNPRSAPYSNPPPPSAAYSAKTEGEIKQTTEIRLYICSVPFHNNPAEIW